MQVTPKTHVPNEPVERTQEEGLVMLKDKLLNLTPRYKCAVGQIISKMDNETKEAFVQVMKGCIKRKCLLAKAKVNFIAKQTCHNLSKIA